MAVPFKRQRRLEVLLKDDSHRPCFLNIENRMIHHFEDLDREGELYWRAISDNCFI